MVFWSPLVPLLTASCVQPNLCLGPLLTEKELEKRAKKKQEASNGEDVEDTKPGEEQKGKAAGESRNGDGDHGEKKNVADAVESTVAGLKKLSASGRDELDRAESTEN